MLELYKVVWDIGNLEVVHSQTMSSCTIKEAHN